MNTRSAFPAGTLSFVLLLVLDDGNTLGLNPDSPSENHQNHKTEAPSPLMNSVRMADHTLADHAASSSPHRLALPAGTCADASLK
jgi:hypothetical protein